MVIVLSIINLVKVELKFSQFFSKFLLFKNLLTR